MTTHDTTIETRVGGIRSWGRRLRRPGGIWLGLGLLCGLTGCTSWARVGPGSSPLVPPSPPAAAAVAGEAGVGANATVDLGFHGLVAGVNVHVSPTVFGDGGEATRVVCASTTLHVGAVMLQRNLTTGIFPEDTVDALRSEAGPVDPALALFMAEDVLGIAGEFVDGPRSPLYDVSVAPAAGRTWADVASWEDVAISVEPKTR